MKYIGFDREDDAERWIRGKLGLKEAPKFYRAMASVDKSGDFAIVVLFTNFSDRNVDINIAMDGVVAPKCILEMFNGVFHFLFDFLMVPRVTGLTGSSNTKANKIIKHFGFSFEGRMRKALPADEDLMVYGFLADEYHQHKWFR
jgi:hypothetical protein